MSTIPFKVCLNHDKTNEHWSQVKAIIEKEPPVLNPGDTLSLTYKLSVDLDESEKQVDAMIRLLTDNELDIEFPRQELQDQVNALKRYVYKVNRLLNAGKVQRTRQFFIEQSTL